jgi:hypothetical protein
MLYIKFIINKNILNLQNDIIFALKNTMILVKVI